MPDVHIERLALKLVTGDKSMGKPAAVRLAESVAAGLSRMPPAADLPLRLETIRVRVNAAPGATSDALSESILYELMKELRRS